MRIGVVFEPNSAAFYRAVDPMMAMTRRGHTVIWPEADGHADARRLTACDLVHVYRRADVEMQNLMRRGMPMVYDNDDDFTAMPKESPDYRKFGASMVKKIHALTVMMAKSAHCFTTTNERLAERYRRDGVRRIEVIANHIDPGLARPRIDHEGFVIGWVAGIDHQADVVRLPIREALEKILAKHRNVRVECIGLDLKLGDRYRHHSFVPFRDLPKRIGGWDVGIAPLADIPANQTRSDVKVREYAASGIPWLASPIGPYADLGEEQGGHLVPPDGWFEALDTLISSESAQRSLAGKAQAWAKGLSIETVADRWERIFTAAAATRV